MEPRSYCEEAIEEVRSKCSERFRQADGPQLVVVLAHFAQQRPVGRDFASSLKMLAMSAERNRRYSLANAAREVLRDWEARARLQPCGV